MQNREETLSCSLEKHVLCSNSRYLTDRTVKLHRYAELRVQLLDQRSVTRGWVDEGKEGEMWLEVEDGERARRKEEKEGDDHDDDKSSQKQNSEINVQLCPSSSFSFSSSSVVLF